MFRARVYAAERWMQFRDPGSISCIHEDSSAFAKPKLLDSLRLALRSRHYSRKTEKSYIAWVKRFVYFHGVRHPAEMGEPEINAFLTSLAVKDKVSASTQNQAISALLFLYRHIIGREIDNLGEVVRARKPKRLPVVMTREEVKSVLGQLSGNKWLMVSLMYGTGLRLMECLQLRILDIDFARDEILVRNGKGAKDRVTMLPESHVRSLFLFRNYQQTENSPDTIHSYRDGNPDLLHTGIVTIRTYTF